MWSLCIIFVSVHISPNEIMIDTIFNFVFSSVQLLSCVRLFVTPWTTARQASLSITNSWSLPKLMSIESVIIQPPHSLLSPSPPAFNLSHIGVFSSESALCIRWPKYWSFSFSISPSSDYSRQIFFRIDWFDLLEVQVTLKSFLQHHSSKASILPVLSFLYSPTLTSIHDYWKNHSFD